MGTSITPLNSSYCDYWSSFIFSVKPFIFWICPCRFVQFGADQDCHCGAIDCRRKLGVKGTKPKTSSEAALKLVACQVAVSSPKLKAILSGNHVCVSHVSIQLLNFCRYTNSRLSNKMKVEIVVSPRRNKIQCHVKYVNFQLLINNAFVDLESFMLLRDLCSRVIQIKELWSVNK